MGKERSRCNSSTCYNVLTPDRIPEFCIPPRHQGQNDLRMRSRHNSITNLFVSAFEARMPCPFEKHIIQVDSIEDPFEEESTNADPQSQAALSLPHLPKAHTSYGFCTLLESPNTKRKESLFHNDPDAMPILLPRSRSSTITCRGVCSLSSFTNRRFRPLRRSGTLDSDTASSADSSPFGSPKLNRSLQASLLKALNQDGILSRALKANCKMSTVRNNSLSTDDESSTDSSPCVTRRSSYDWSQHSLAQSDIGLLLVPGRFSLDNTVTLNTGGIVRLSAEYHPENSRLRVRLVSAEGLFKQSVDPKNVSCYFSLSLMPGKSQKQRSTLIRGSRNPIFNEDFFFEELESQDLLEKTLKIKAIHKGSCVKRECILGKCKLQLLSILPV
uniref:C2 domain-containing protein n=1 Tax=Leptobrachium leishanense TaxID=445787 RepID=A0A8C5P922_9ANUR